MSIIISSTRSSRMSASTRRSTRRGERPPTEGTSMTSSSPTMEVRQQPWIFLSSSALAVGVRSPTATSLVRCEPPRAKTEVCLMLFWEKMAMSTVPPPKSRRATPSSFSSGVKTASAEATDSSTMSRTSRPARWAQRTRFWALVMAPVTMWTLASSRTPPMPTGSWMPAWLSTMNSWGMVWMTSRSMGMTMVRAASRTRSTSLGVTSRFFMAMTPWLLRPSMWPPAIPT